MGLRFLIITCAALILMFSATGCSGLHRQWLEADHNPATDRDGPQASQGPESAVAGEGSASGEIATAELPATSAQAQPNGASSLAPEPDLLANVAELYDFPGLSLENPPLQRRVRRDQALPPQLPGKPFRAKDGPYVGAMFSLASVDGDFDGETILVGGDGIILIPELDTGTGYGFAAGYRASTVGVELNYQRVNHDVDFLGAEGDARFNTVNLDFKWFFRPESRLQPSALFGLAIPWLVVEHGSADSSGNVDDATLVGIGLNLGGGLSYFVDADGHLALNMGGGYRWLSYTSADGAGISGTLDDSLSGSGWFLLVGATYTF